MVKASPLSTRNLQQKKGTETRLRGGVGRIGTRGLRGGAGRIKTRGLRGGTGRIGTRGLRGGAGRIGLRGGGREDWVEGRGQGGFVLT